MNLSKIVALAFVVVAPFAVGCVASGPVESDEDLGTERIDGEEAVDGADAEVAGEEDVGEAEQELQLGAVGSGGRRRGTAVDGGSHGCSLNPDGTTLCWCVGILDCLVMEQSCEKDDKGVPIVHCPVPGQTPCTCQGK